MIRPVNIEDASQLAEIYNFYILNTIVTFEAELIDETEMRSRIRSNTSKFPWIVYEKDVELLGYAYAGEWNSRYAYKNTVESTIYLKDTATNKGIGFLLYQFLINQLKEMRFHAIIGGISLPNPASVALHEKCGFEKVAHYKEVGYKFDRWIDVGYWELLVTENDSYLKPNTL